MSRLLTPAFVLHRRNYQEASLLVDLLTRDHGRVCAVARGARKSRRQRAGLLQHTVPLQVGLSGRGQLLTLGAAEAEGPALLTVGTKPALMGLYLSELVLRLTARDDPNPDLFQAYLATLVKLASGDSGTALRQFEMRLLRSLGYAVMLEQEAETDRPVTPEQRYYYVVEEGPVVGAGSAGSFSVSGATLLYLADLECRSEDSESTATSNDIRREARLLMAHILGHYLGNKPLKSRQFFQQMNDLKKSPVETIQ